MPTFSIIFQKHLVKEFLWSTVTTEIFSTAQ